MSSRVRISECATNGTEHFGRPPVLTHASSILRRDLSIVKAKLAITALAIAGLIGSTYTADAKSQKAHKSSMTTGANMKPSAKGPAANPSGQGNVGPGTNNNNGPAPGGR